MDRQKEVHTVDDNELDKHWWNNNNVVAQYAKIPHEISDTLVEFQHMWYGLLGRWDMAKNCIELTALDVRPIKLPCTVLDRKARDLEKAEFDKMLGMNVIEPA